MDFHTRTNLHCAIDDMISFFATYFVENKGDKRNARKMLEQTSQQMRREDAIIISFFGGCACIMTMVACFFLFTPPSDQNFNEGRYI